MLHAAVYSYSTKILEQVLAETDDVDALVMGKTALMLALQTCQLDMAYSLVAKGASLKTLDDRGTPACFYGMSLEAVRWMLDHGVDGQETDASGKTLTEHAASQNHACVRALLERTNISSISLLVALKALVLDHVDAVLDQVEAESRYANIVCARDYHGRTPLHFAAMHDLEDIVDRLSRLGVPVDASDEGGMTPLMYAVKYAAEDSVELLLKYKANVLLTDQAGYSVLHMAVKSANANIVFMLLEHGANVHARDPMGQTPLHVAAKHGLVQVSKMLLTRGASCKARDKCRRTPFDLACAHGFAYKAYAMRHYVFLHKLYQ